LSESATFERGRVAAETIEGVRVNPLTPHRDPRGCVTELFRDEWPSGMRPIQWNLLISEAGTLRGIHVHHRHEDYQVLVSGRATIALSDLRRGHPRRGVAFEVTGDDPAAVIVPRGVAHGLCSTERSVFIVGVTGTYDPGDDIAIHYADPGLGITWPEGPHLVSERDSAAPALEDVLPQLEPYQPFPRP
jgi:dTDP-4-dehydrorhamnose 3,5-epimerase